MKAPFPTPVRIDSVDRNNFAIVHETKPDHYYTMVCRGIQNKEWADFIRTAINSHEALVEALTGMLADVEECKANPQGHAPGRFIATARKALRLAKGEKP